MYVKSIAIENVRGFGSGERAVSLDFSRERGPLAGWTVLAGRNGAGKTTFLRAIALALAGPEFTRTLSDSFAGWIRDGQEEARVTVSLEPNSDADRFRGLGKLPRKISGSLSWKRDPGGQEPNLSSEPPLRTKLYGPWRGPWSENPDGWFVAGYGPFRRLTGHATEALRMMVGPYHVKRLVSLFREDASLVECVEWLKAVYLQRLEKRAGFAQLEATVLRLLDNGLLPDGMRVEKIDSTGLWVKQHGVKLSLREISDGYRTMAALVLDLVRQIFDCYGELVAESNEDDDLLVLNPGVVLVDEIDVHLHVSWQQRIGFWLKKHFPNIQFLVSTHSPFICQAADSRGLIRLPAPGEGEAARHVEGEQFRRIVYGSADDAALTELFGLETTYSGVALAKRGEYSRLRAKQIRGAATEREKRRLKELQMELPLGPRQEVAAAVETLRELDG